MHFFASAVMCDRKYAEEKSEKDKQTTLLGQWINREYERILTIRKINNMQALSFKRCLHISSCSTIHSCY